MSGFDASIAVRKESKGVRPLYGYMRPLELVKETGWPFGQTVSVSQPASVKAIDSLAAENHRQVVASRTLGLMAELVILHIFRILHRNNPIFEESGKRPHFLHWREGNG